MPALLPHARYGACCCEYLYSYDVRSSRRHPAGNPTYGHQVHLAQPLHGVKDSYIYRCSGHPPANARQRVSASQENEVLSHISDSCVGAVHAPCLSHLHVSSLLVVRGEQSPVISQDPTQRRFRRDLNVRCGQRGQVKAWLRYTDMWGRLLPFAPFPYAGGRGTRMREACPGTPCSRYNRKLQGGVRFIAEGNKQKGFGGPIASGEESRLGEAAALTCWCSQRLARSAHPPCAVQPFGSGRRPSWIE